MNTTPNVQSFDLQDTHGRPLRLTIGTDVVDYAESARAFGREDLAAPDAHGRYQKRLFAFPDHAARVVSPMLLSVGSQNTLALIRRIERAGSVDWKLSDLTGAFGVVGAKPQVRAVGVGWTDDDRVTIAVAVDGGGDGQPSRVFVAWNLSTRTTDWSKLPWIDCGTRDRISVEGIRVLPDAEGNWTVVLAGPGAKSDSTTFYLLRSERPSPRFGDALVFTPAVTMQEMLDYQTAIDPFVGPGLAVVGQSGGSPVLSFRPFPNYDDTGRITDTPPTVPLPCPPDARLLQPGVTRNGGTDLYIAGNGVHLIPADEFDNLEEAKLTAVADAKILPDLISLVVADAPDGSAAVWTLRRNGDLAVARRARGETRWGQPLILRHGVQDIAAVHGDRHVITSLLVVYRDGKASFIWNDAAAGVWQEASLLVESPERTSRVTCYGTTLRVLDGDGLPRRDVEVTVSASVLANVAINGSAGFLGPNLSLTAKTDSFGNVTLFDRARSLTPAILRFNVAGLGSSIDVNPAAVAHQRFSTITAQDLREASVTAPDGKKSPLLGEDIRADGRRDDLQAVAGGLNEAAKLTASTNGAGLGVRITPNGGAFSSAVKADILPDGYKWGITADANGVRPLNATAMNGFRSGLLQANFLSGIGDSIGDFFGRVWDGLKEGWSFLVEKTKEGINFICKIGNIVKRWVLDTLEQIGGFFTWLWEQIKTGLEQVWAWIKFIFDWKDILRVRDSLVKMVEQSLDKIADSAPAMKKSVESAFDSVAKTVQEWTGEPPGPEPGSSFVGDALKVVGEVAGVMNKVMGNAGVSWVLQKLQDFIDAIVRIEMPQTGTSLGSVLDNLTTSLGGLAVELENVMRKVMEALMRVLGTAVDFKNLSPELIKRALVSAGGSVLQSLVRLGRRVTLILVEAMEAIVRFCRAVMTAKVRFPLIEQLVETLTFGLVKVDTSFRLIDGMMLMFAVPITILSKLAGGGLPLLDDKPRLKSRELLKAEKSTMEHVEVLANPAVSLALLATVFRDAYTLGAGSSAFWQLGPIAITGFTLAAAGEYALLGVHQTSDPVAVTMACLSTSCAVLAVTGFLRKSWNSKMQLILHFPQLIHLILSGVVYDRNKSAYKQHDDLFHVSKLLNDIGSLCLTHAKTIVAFAADAGDTTAARNSKYVQACVVLAGGIRGGGAGLTTCGVIAGYRGA